jgi:hypothetical protein
MRQLTDAREQGTLCATCHIGNHAKGMFITHAMYMAGHPPLPAFELQHFVASMPAHWRGPRETYDKLANFNQRQRYFELNFGPYAAASSVKPDQLFWETRQLLLGAISAAEASIELVAQAGEHWGDYALYDCAACHHELRTPSVRQQYRQGNAPGRPRLQDWPTPLLTVALHMADPTDRVKALRQKLAATVSQTPFGEPSACATIATQLQLALRETNETLSLQILGADEARQVLGHLASSSDEDLLDYYAARQAVWGLQTVDDELAFQGHAIDDATRQLIRELGKRGQQTLISTRLPAGRALSLLDPVQGESFLSAELERMRQYDADFLHMQFDALRKRLR